MMAPVSDVEVEVSHRGGGRRRGRELSLDDCRCPVCLEIFMEPVTLPCTHTFCKECFLESVDKATLCCPLCRKRVSSWARLNSRNNTLVDQQLWMHIQTCFPLQCQRRLNGQDAVTEDDPVSVSCHTVSRPGELKQEFEDQIHKLTEERRALDEEERRASEEYIQRLLSEEEQLLQEERRRHQDDERLARQLSSQLNSVSQENLGPADITPVKKKKKKEVSGGQMEKFLCPLPSNSSSSDCSFIANKENILLSQVDSPLLRLDYHGPHTDESEPPSASVEHQQHPAAHGSHLTANGGPSSTKRKSLEPETAEDEETTVSKQGCCFLPSSSSCPSLEAEGSTLQGVTKWEVELLRRRQQEEEDRQLAVLLQKELDQEERQRATDRRKGSSDPYPLRQNHQGGVEAGSANTSRRPSRKTSTPSSTKISTPSSRNTSTPSSTPSSRNTSTPSTTMSSSPSSTLPSTKTSTLSSPCPSSRGNKQTTLTEMFFSLTS